MEPLYEPTARRLPGSRIKTTDILLSRGDKKERKTRYFSCIRNVDCELGLHVRSNGEVNYISFDV